MSRWHPLPCASGKADLGAGFVPVQWAEFDLFACVVLPRDYLRQHLDRSGGEQ